MTSSHLAFQVNYSLQKSSIAHNFDHIKASLSSAFKMFYPLLGLPKYGGLAKLFFDEQIPKPSTNRGESNRLRKVESHEFADNNFCTGTVLIAKHDGSEEDDGWLVSFVHNGDTNVTQVHITDAKKLENEAIAKITLSRRVLYDFRGTFVQMPHHPWYYQSMLAPDFIK